MLTELHIENLGVIERLELMLGAGLTALTGETGAGKTMLVDAIELLVGGRADTSIVRHGAEEARVDGRFVAADGTETILSRVVPAVGRSRAYVNGRLATVTLLGRRRRRCRRPARAARPPAPAVDCDATRGARHLRRMSISVRSAQARARLTEIDAGLAALGGDERARAREIDLLRYQVAELDAANIVDAGEDAVLDAEESVLADASAHRAGGTTAYGLLADDDGARDSLGNALAAIDGRQPYLGITPLGCARCSQRSTT